MSHFIGGQWTKGKGPAFASFNPATGETIWQGTEADQGTVGKALESGKRAFDGWRSLSFESRTAFLERYAALLAEKQRVLAETIARETGKPLWESLGEVGAMVNKVKISIEAYKLRCPEQSKETAQGTSITRHRPHGVLGVLGPYNFPGHLPNGHIVPALLAGNTVVFKPSELTPLVAEQTVGCWAEVGLPAGVINLVQGGKITGQALAEDERIDGILFTGSWNTGSQLALSMAKTPGKILALEMGGNNPLIVGTVSNHEAAAYLTIQSAFLTSGQRCTCARRLIVLKGASGDAFIDTLIRQTKDIIVGSYDEKPEPFMGPLISSKAAESLLAVQKELCSNGALPLLPLTQLPKGKAFLTPGILDVSGMKGRRDEEYFGPLLQVIRVESFEQAVTEANNTRFGLSAGILSDRKDEFDLFYSRAKSGVVNWNTPLTGASSSAPFGGIGCSGNNRPSALYAADYCSYPVASMTAGQIKLPDAATPGITLRKNP